VGQASRSAARPALSVCVRRHGAVPQAGDGGAMGRRQRRRDDADMTQALPRHPKPKGGSESRGTIRGIDQRPKGPE